MMPTAPPAKKTKLQINRVVTMMLIIPYFLIRPILGYVVRNERFQVSGFRCQPFHGQSNRKGAFKNANPPLPENYQATPWRRQSPNIKILYIVHIFKLTERSDTRIRHSTFDICRLLLGPFIIQAFLFLEIPRSRQYGDEI